MEITQNLVFEASGPFLIRARKVKTTTVALKTLFVIITVFIHAAIHVALTVALKESHLGHLDSHGVDLTVIDLSRRVSSARPPTDIKVGGA